MPPGGMTPRARRGQARRAGKHPGDVGGDAVELGTVWRGAEAEDVGVAADVGGEGGGEEVFEGGEGGEEVGERGEGEDGAAGVEGAVALEDGRAGGGEAEGFEARGAVGVAAGGEDGVVGGGPADGAVWGFCFGEWGLG